MIDYDKFAEVAGDNVAFRLAVEAAVVKVRFRIGELAESPFENRLQIQALENIIVDAETWLRSGE